MVSAIVHGNEPCGVIALDWLFRKEIPPIAGSLTLAFINVEAYRAFDPADPNATRWIDEDMNRVWDQSVLEGERNSLEIERALTTFADAYAVAKAPRKLEWQRGLGSVEL